MLNIDRGERAIPMADRISTLSDELLCHILSFLPTEEAVATSVLSKRWKSLWLSVSALYFNDIRVYDKEYHLRFNQFVDAVMQLRDAQQPIKKFRLICLSHIWDTDSSNFNKWVNTAIQRRVEHLHLEVSPNIKFPYGILRCSTLVVLKLWGFILKGFSYVDLPSLKIAHLEFVTFFERGYLIKLLSACPILEDLETVDLQVIHYLHRKDICVSLPKLVRADISYLDMPLKTIYNVKSLRLTKVQLYYNAIPVFHNLTHMELIFENFSWHWLVEVLKHCPKLQILVVDKMEMNEIYDENWTYPLLVPECLSLHLRTCTLRSYVDLKGELLFARYIMQNARVLQTMTICSIPLLGVDEKLKILKKLSLCPWSSATCKLLFE